MNKYVEESHRRLEAIKADIIERRKSAETILETLRRTRPMAAKLYPYQVVGAAWVAGTGPGEGRLLCDEMGLGKTAQTLTAVGDRVLIVAPTSVVSVWKREVAMWRPDLTFRTVSRSAFEFPKAGEAVVVTWGSLPAITEAPPGVDLVFDEVHYAKGGNKAHRAKRARALAEAVRAAGGRVFGLTGTPILNRARELWEIMRTVGCYRVINADESEAWRLFKQMFNLQRGRFGLYESGPLSDAQSEEIKRVLSPVMLRRTRQQVLPDLPPVRHELRVVGELDDPARLAVEELVAWLEQHGKTVDDLVDLTTSVKTSIPFDLIARMRAAVAASKIPDLREVVKEFEEADEPLVVFSAHKAPIEVLGQREGWAIITGDTPPTRRAEIVDRFQSGDLKGVGITIAAGGVGLTLTKAANVVFVDRSWTPANNDQAMSRVVRIGQTRGVRVITLVADHPIDHRVNEILIAKEELIRKADVRVADEEVEELVAIIAREVEAEEKAAKEDVEYARRLLAVWEAAKDAVQVVERVYDKGRRGPQTDDEKAAWEWVQTVDPGNDEFLASLKGSVVPTDDGKVRGLTDKQFHWLVLKHALSQNPDAMNSVSVGPYRLPDGRCVQVMVSRKTGQKYAVDQRTGDYLGVGPVLEIAKLLASAPNPTVPA
ncbi:MAG: hypothetical protein KatS3mg082_1393 [Nitrospiraceae bacterium]|nr:MAG: hypothetical protein KatS3mg082_1393 [Nitrospiraceae bacterium]